MKLTRSNIAHDLAISPHRVTIPYADNSKVTYIFSSALYASKFQEKREGKRKQIEESLQNRFGFSIDAEVLADIRTYIEIEKRGFRLEKGDETFVCQDSIRLDGGKVISKNSVEP